MSTWNDDDSWRDSLVSEEEEPVSSALPQPDTHQPEIEFPEELVSVDDRGSTERPREVFDNPEVRPPAPQVNRREPEESEGPVRPASPPAPMPSSGGGSPAPNQSMTPVRPKQPTPVSTQAPTAPTTFTPMEPLAAPNSMVQPMNESYSAAQVQQRAPFMPDPVQAGPAPREVFNNPEQYGIERRTPGMLGRAGGLTGGGLGLPGGSSGGIDQSLDALLRALFGES